MAAAHMQGNKMNMQLFYRLLRGCGSWVVAGLVMFMEIYHDY
jgi:hypothetical protein